MNDNVIDILVQLKADLAAGKETVAELKELKRQAIAAGVSTGDLDKQIASAEKSAVGMAKKIEEAGKGGTHHIEGLHRAVGFLGAQFGEVGHLAHFALSLPALGLAALGIGISKVVEHFKALNEQAEKFATRMDTIELNKLNAARDALSSTAIEMRQLNDELQHAGDKTDPLHGKKFSDEKAERMARFGLQDDLDAAAIAKGQAAHDLKNNKELSDANERLKDAKNQEADLMKTARENGETVAAYEKSFGPGIGKQESEAGEFYRNAVGARAKANEELERNRTAQRGYQSTIDYYGNLQVSANREARSAKGAATFNSSRIGDLNESIAAGDLGAATGSASEALGTAEGIAGRIKSGGTATQDEKNLLRAVASNINGSNVSIEQAVKMLADDAKYKQQFLERLIRAIETYGGMNTGLDARLRTLESQMKSSLQRP